MRNPGKGVEVKCDKLYKKYNTAIVSLKSEERNNKIEQTERLKEIDENLGKVIKQVHKKHTTVIYQGQLDDRYKVTFRGKKFENPIEFICRCEKEMEAVGNSLADEEKIDWIARNLHESARLWYNIMRDKIT